MLYKWNRLISLELQLLLYNKKNFGLKADFPAKGLQKTLDPSKFPYSFIMLSVSPFKNLIWAGNDAFTLDNMLTVFQHFELNPEGNNKIQACYFFFFFGLGLTKHLTTYFAKVGHKRRKNPHVLIE